MEPGGLWDAGRFEVVAWLHRNGQAAGQLRLAYAGSPSQFEGTWIVEGPGTYEALVWAHEPATGNTGLDRVTFMVE